MRRLCLTSLMLLLACPAVSAERLTVGGELICFKRDALAEFGARLREQGAAALQSVPGCIAAQPGLVLRRLGPAGAIDNVGTVTRIRALSFETREFFDGFTSARF